jgi:hypothetical protein
MKTARIVLARDLQHPLPDCPYITEKLLKARTVGLGLCANKEIDPIQLRKQSSPNDFPQAPFDTISVNDFPPVFGHNYSDSRIQ